MKYSLLHHLKCLPGFRNESAPMKSNGHKYSVLFVCMGNICRSPTAEGVFRHQVNEAGLSDAIFIDSAGTHAYHSGEPADRRSVQAAEKRGYDLQAIRARRVTDEDFERFDLVLAMDDLNLVTLQDRCPAEYKDKLGLFLSFVEGLEGQSVPDPYYGAHAGFERVLDLVEEAGMSLLASLRERDLV